MVVDRMSVSGMEPIQGSGVLLVVSVAAVCVMRHLRLHLRIYLPGSTHLAQGPTIDERLACW